MKLLQIQFLIYLLYTLQNLKDSNSFNFTINLVTNITIKII
jgi:hypothetical protein